VPAGGRRGAGRGAGSSRRRRAADRGRRACGERGSRGEAGQEGRTEEEGGTQEKSCEKAGQEGQEAGEKSQGQAEKGGQEEGQEAALVGHGSKGLRKRLPEWIGEPFFLARVRSGKARGVPEGKKAPENGRRSLQTRITAYGAGDRTDPADARGA